MPHPLIGAPESMTLILNLVLDKVRVGYYYPDRYKENWLLVVAGNGAWPDGWLIAWSFRILVLNSARLLEQQIQRASDEQRQPYNASLVRANQSNNSMVTKV